MDAPEEKKPKKRLDHRSADSRDKQRLFIECKVDPKTKKKSITVTGIILLSFAECENVNEHSVYAANATKNFPKDPEERKKYKEICRKKFQKGINKYAKGSSRYYELNTKIEVYFTDKSSPSSQRPDKIEKGFVIEKYDPEECTQISKQVLINMCLWAGGNGRKADTAIDGRTLADTQIIRFECPEMGSGGFTAGHEFVHLLGVKAHSNNPLNLMYAEDKDDFFNKHILHPITSSIVELNGEQLKIIFEGNTLNLKLENSSELVEKSFSGMSQNINSSKQPFPKPRNLSDKKTEPFRRNSETLEKRRIRIRDQMTTLKDKIIDECFGENLNEKIENHAHKECKILSEHLTILLDDKTPTDLLEIKLDECEKEMKRISNDLFPSKIVLDELSEEKSTKNPQKLSSTPEVRWQNIKTELGEIEKEFKLIRETPKNHIACDCFKAMVAEIKPSIIAKQNSSLIDTEGKLLGIKNFLTVLKNHEHPNDHVQKNPEKYPAPKPFS